MCLKLNSDAIFIADSHYTKENPQGLIHLLHSLCQNSPTQLILMGDIAQILIGNVPSSIRTNKVLLRALNALEKQGTQLIWLEGNHDFALSSIPKFGLLKHTLFIPRKKQPLLANYNNQYYLLAHGDLFIGKKYELYIKTLTKCAKLFAFLDLLTSGDIYEPIREKVENKTIRKHSFYFYELASKRLEAYKALFAQFPYPIAGIIEGHFHIGKKIDLQNLRYIALPSFYFSQKPIPLSKILD